MKDLGNKQRILAGMFITRFIPSQAVGSAYDCYFKLIWKAEKEKNSNSYSDIYLSVCDSQDNHRETESH